GALPSLASMADVDDGGEAGAHAEAATEAAVAPESVEVRGAAAQPLRKRITSACCARLRPPSRSMVAVLGAQAALCAAGLTLVLTTYHEMPEDASIATVPRPVHLPVVLFLLILFSLCVLSLVGVFLSSPLLSLPYFVGAIIATVILAIATVNSFRIIFLVHRDAQIAVTIALILVTGFMILSLTVQTSYIRREIKNKKAVTGCPDPSEPKQAETSPAVIKVSKFESFSRRSTIIISDDFYIPPPEK
ncbi:hypothetical protein PMAYCL1PPCAC_03789, partial [Pristionchus mayeri]